MNNTTMHEPVKLERDNHGQVAVVAFYGDGDGDGVVIDYSGNAISEEIRWMSRHVSDLSWPRSSLAGMRGLWVWEGTISLVGGGDGESPDVYFTGTWRRPRAVELIGLARMT
jgi:hypothetical protein